MHKYLLILLLTLSNCVYAQQPDTSIFKYPIKMDEVVVSAVRGGWDVNGFIRRVKNDTTFYKAFKSLRVVSYNAINDIRVYDNRGAIKASYYSKTHQQVQNGCRTMTVENEKVSGNFFKNDRRYRYYTAELYGYLFFTNGKVCGDNDIVAGTLYESGRGSLEKNKYRLKQLMFNPGSKVAGVPFMGDKAAIFEPDVAKMYNFRLESDTYEGQDCYVFKAIPKKEYADDVVYNEFNTWFRKSDYAIVARDYSLSYNTMVYDFDVRMHVRTTQVGKRLLPSYITYDGNWYVFSKGRERVKFTTTLSY